MKQRKKMKPTSLPQPIIGREKDIREIPEVTP